MPIKTALVIQTSRQIVVIFITQTSSSDNKRTFHNDYLKIVDNDNVFLLCYLNGTIKFSRSCENVCNVTNNITIASLVYISYVLIVILHK